MTGNHHGELQTYEASMPDCIALCAPGVTLTVQVLIERVLLHTAAGAELDGFGIGADELYDCLIKSESKPINRLLFVSPHALFDVSDHAGTFPEHVRSVPWTNDENWHFAHPPVCNGVTVTAYLHSREYSSSKPAPFQVFEGNITQPIFQIPQQLSSSEAIVALAGLGRSVFECHFNPPIPAQQSAWIRVGIRPRKLSLPDPSQYPGLESVGMKVYSQLLDVLAPETMLEAFRDLLITTRNPSQLPREFGEPLGMEVFEKGLLAVSDFVFKQGFDAPGTYTRIEDHRILIGSDNCRINFIKEEGAVGLQAISPIKVGERPIRIFHWYSGTKDYPHLDPVAAAEKLYNYVADFAKDSAAAKSKVYLTYATEINHLLGCEIIDEFGSRGFFNQMTSQGDRGGEMLYCLNTSRTLPKSGHEHYQILTEIAVSIAQRTRLQRGHFRVFFEALWTENGKTTH